MLNRRQFLKGLGLTTCLPTQVMAVSHVEPFWTQPREEHPTVYLTVDDGWLAQEEILSSFVRAKAIGTFYVTGVALLAHRKIWQQALELGMEIGCHGYGHLMASRISEDRFLRDLAQYAESARQVFGADWRTVVGSFRFPYGDLGGRRRLQLERRLWEEHGWHHVEWTMDLSFSHAKGLRAYTSVEAPFEIYKQQRIQNSVVLTHFVRNDARVLARILEENPGGAIFSGISGWLDASTLMHR